MSLAGVVICGGLFTIAMSRGGSPGFDFYAYWSVDAADPYGAGQGFGAFHYSPVVAQLVQPLKLLPWPAVYWAYLALLIAVLVWLCRGWTLAALAFPPVAMELYHGNIHLLLAAAAVIGLTHGGAWAFPVLTKVTPGIGVLWFAVRREWRPMWTAGLTTAAFVVASAVIAPQLWLEWLRHLAVAETIATPNQVPVPLVVRLVLAAVVLLWGARRGWTWVIPIAMTLALPVLWFHGLAVLVAVVPLVASDRRRRRESGQARGVRNLEIHVASPSGVGSTATGGRPAAIS
jgi:hypothetical protein